jgi:hypothetical protein
MKSTNSSLGLFVALGMLVLINWPGYAHADPYIQGNPGAFFSLLNPDFSTPIGLSYSSTVIQQYSTTSQHGGGEASGGVGSDGSNGVGGGAYLTSTGTGSASVSADIEQITTVTNTNPTDGSYLLIMDMVWNTTVYADPYTGDTLSTSWNIGFNGLPPFGGPLNFSTTCSPANPDPYSCNNFYDYDEYWDEPFFIGAGQTASFDMIAQFDLFVSSVPEPGSLTLFATGLLCLGGVCRRRSDNSQRLS